jgi:micrococcal nuclease
MKKLLILLFIVALLVSCAPATEGQVRVMRVIDGDTIEIAGGAHVRYIGIDTPETYPQAEPFGPEAKAKNIELVEGKLVTLERDVSDTDRYGRLLRYVYVDGMFVNGELVRLGYAEAIACPPDTRYQWQLELLEVEAKAAGRGMWGD